MPARELRDQTISLSDVWGKEAGLLTERLLLARTAEARYELLQAELIRRCRSFTRHDDCAVRVAKLIERRRGRISVAELSRTTGIAQRTLLSRFDDWVGLTPKQIARTARLRCALARIGPVESGVRWADIALECGFYDQAHLIHEFQELLGLTPGAFLAGRRSFSPIGAPAFGRNAVPLRERTLYRNLGLVSDWAAETSQAPDFTTAPGVRPAEIYNPEREAKR